jgi:serine/threonine-protein kinase
MLSGKRIFTGDTVTDILASVLKSELEWSALPDDLPDSLHRLLRRCLERNPKQRLQSIGEARIALDNYLDDPSPVEMSPEKVAAPSQQSIWRRTVPWALFGLASLTAVLFAVAPHPEQPESPMRLDIQIADEPLLLGLGSSGVLSPDGTRIATVVGDDNATNLFIRSMDQLEGSKLASGEGVGSPYQPFFSPDGKWLGYVTSNELLKVPVSGGAALKLCDVERSRGASWGPDDTIIFTPTPNSPLFRVPAAGGEPEAITTLDAEAGEATHRWPQVLPSGKAVVFTSHTQAAGGFEAANIELLNLETGERKVIHRGGSYARYVPSGHLVYVNQGTLFAMPFDAGTLEPTGSPAPVVQEVAWSLAHGGAQFEFSETGRMIYLKEENIVPEYPVVWVDDQGSTAPLWDEQGSYANPRLSPDGKRLALTVLRESNWDIWVYDLERGVSTRLTFDEAVDTEQVWSPDGEYLVFSSDRNGADNLYRKRADGSGDLERLTDNPKAQWATSWSSDGRHLAFMVFEDGFDVWVQSLDENQEAEPFLTTPFNESDPSFSPNGRWLAYTSNESGRPEVYVRPFPLRGGKWQVSDGGGAYPRWSRDGDRLYYRTDAGLMVASVDTSGETFRAGKAQPLLDGSFQGGTAGLGLAGNVFADYDVAPDGKRFVLFPGAEDSGQGVHPHATLITHWFDELTRTFAAGGN